MRISDWISDVCSADLRARITFVVIPFSSVKQTAAGQKQVKSSGYGHGQANRRDLEDAKSGLSRNARHVIDKQICRSADQCAATGQHSDIRQRHQIALRGLFKSQCDVTHDWRAKHDDRRLIEEPGHPRSEARRVGKESVSTWRSQGA